MESDSNCNIVNLHCTNNNGELFPGHSDGELSCFTINIRSLRNKFGELKNYLAIMNVSFTFIIVTEVWLDAASIKGFQIDGYKSKYCVRNNNGGGVLVFHRDFIKVEIDNNYSGIFDTHESLFLNCFIKNYGRLFLWAVYRPPQMSVTSFCDYLEDNLNRLVNKKVILTGDFNINMMDNLSLATTRFTNVLVSFNFKHCINRATYFSSIARAPTSLLDDFWYNINTNYKSYIVYPPISDHMGIALFLNVRIQQKFEISFRNFSPNNKSNFVDNLEWESSLFSFETNDAVLETGRFFAWAQYLVDKYFPVKKKVISAKRLSSPWITSSIKKCINKKHRWFKMFRAKVITYRSYREYCKMVGNLLKIAERQYYSNKFRALNRDSRKNWQFINSLLGNEKVSIPCELNINNALISDQKVIADAFGEFFCRVPNDIVSGIPPSTLNGMQHMERVTDSLFFHPCTPNEICKIVVSLKNSSDDCLSIKMIKIGKDYFSPIISELINLCINVNTFPDVLKVARIVPVYKSGPKSNVSNYRPISILGTLNKIFEKIIYYRLNSFFEAKSLFSETQFGFRSNRSTELAVLHLIAKIMPAFEEKGYSFAVFLDLSKAFDTVNYNILIRKLKCYGVRGRVLELVESYLSNRKFFVRLSGVKSELFDVAIGVPQGSCLGPLLYNIYTNDLHKFLITKLLNVSDILYADDTVLVSSNKNLTSLEVAITSAITNFNEWCKYNKLSINISKTRMMVFSNRVTPPVSIKLDGLLIQCVDEFKYLGVWLDSKLRFQPHLDALHSRLSHYCGMSVRLGHLMPLVSAKSFYFAFIFQLFYIVF